MDRTNRQEISKDSRHLSSYRPIRQNRYTQSTPDPKEQTRPSSLVHVGHHPGISGNKERLKKVKKS